MDFSEAEIRYRELRMKNQAGMIDDEAFEQQLKDLMVQDEQGRWWVIAGASGKWNIYESATGNWIESEPPKSGTYFSPSQAQPEVQRPPVPIEAQARSQPERWVSPPQPARESASAAPAGEQPLDSSNAIIFYLVSFFVPLVGLILFFIYKDKPFESDRKMARVSLGVAGISFALGCLCSACVFILPLISSGNT